MSILCASVCNISPCFSKKQILYHNPDVEFEECHCYWMMNCVLVSVMSSLYFFILRRVNVGKFKDIRDTKAHL